MTSSRLCKFNYRGIDCTSTLDIDLGNCWRISWQTTEDMDSLAYNSIDDIWNYQLQDTGVAMEDFQATGMVPLAESPKYKSQDELIFKTP
jgi:hypothetical protein